MASLLSSLYFSTSKTKRIISTSQGYCETQYLKHLTLCQAHSRHGKNVPRPSLGLDIGQCLGHLTEMHWGEAHWLSASNQREYLRGAGESFRNFDLPACSPLPRPWWFSHRVFSYLRMEVSVPDLQHSRRWMETLGDREQSQGAVALAFGARSPTSRLQSKCIKPAVCAKFSPGFYLVWPIQVLISFNYLKTFKNLENLSNIWLFGLS